MLRGSRLRPLLSFALLLAVSIAAPTGSLHAVMYAALGVLFGRSLLPGREALVTGMARRMRGGRLPDDLARYTRRVTWAWLLFCVAQLLASGLLRLFASRQDWGLFVNLLNLPLLVLMAGGEYAYRRRRYRHHPHASPAGMLKLMRQPWRAWMD